MKLTILGSGTAVPSLQRNSSSLLLQEDGNHSLFDFGYGALHRLLKLGLTYHDIDRVYFTHNHPDHMCDLVPFLFGSRYHLDPREKELEIVAGPGFREYFEGLMGAYNRWLIPTTYNIKITEQGEATRTYGNLSVTTEKVKHIAMSRGYRVTGSDGKTFAVSGDTDYCDGMIRLGKEADLMVLECAFPEELKVAGHLVPKLAGQLAREAGCNKLCLTHFYPPCELEEVRSQCAEEFSGELVLAEDLMEFKL